MLRSKKTTCALVKNQIFVIGQFRPEMDPTHLFGLLVGIARLQPNVALTKVAYIEKLYMKRHSLRSYKAIASRQRGPKSKKICPYTAPTHCFWPFCHNSSILVQSLANKSHSCRKNICYKPLCKVLIGH